ncbi:MAG TPA: proline--tRNA ligase [Candidatus Absconditabacterales bacterium]|nr:proline--tRNA ligase [Candidatus Absconditabacterales bacterium]HRU50470.1 proline--tRNA ligase [Candidatus Absconditabacterales bacterium]
MRKLTSRLTNHSERYNQVVQQADLAESSNVRGCMVIKPYGFAIRENIQGILDNMFKNTGHYNAYFPLFIPKSFLSKEAEHVEGFAKECAVVTHYRLKNDPNGKGVVVDPEAKLEEELIVRPTSETIIWDSYKKWINSYRDLPILCNQRANIVRREMRTRIFLRTSEFLWQEGHTAHATYEEAEAEALKMIDVYKDFSENFLAISPVVGPKPAHDKFAGAIDTYAIEPMMQDFKALQAGTSHFLGQNFGKAFDVKFTNENNELDYVRGTSWGVSTRLIGGLIMAHGDDNGLVIPPALAPTHVVVVPIFKTPEELKEIKEYIKPLIEKMENIYLKFEGKYTKENMKLRYKIDDDPNKTPGRKFNERELKGVPIRITVGKRDIENGMLEIFNRETGEKNSMKVQEVLEILEKQLLDSQKNLLQKNKEFREKNTYYVDSYQDFAEKIEKGFVMAHWDGTVESADKIQEEFKATIRCIPNKEYLEKDDEGKCIVSGKESKGRVLFAKSY